MAPTARRAILAPVAEQADLFGAPGPALPEGMRYEEGFLSPEEEAGLIAHIAQLPLAPMKYREYEALRRVVSYGGQYDFSAQKLGAAEPIAAWLHPLRERAALWIGVAPEAFTQALVAEYRVGTPLGWHRDVPDFEDIVGISLGHEGVMRFRPYPHVAGRRAGTLKLVLQPRSIYLLRGAARWSWQHAVSPTQGLRYSITFRTVRGQAAHPAHPGAS